MPLKSDAGYRARELALEWLKLDQDSKTRQEVQKMLDSDDLAGLSACMEPRIAFGTAGLRARVGAGFARMNGLVVIQTSNGLASHILSSFRSSSSRRDGASRDAAKNSVVVGHDARHGSEYFARLAAAAFLAHGLRVRWLGQVHTPLVPFTVRRLGAACGVMLTASHNPREDNGYKVYAGSAGCQINTPEDAQIAAAILQNLSPLSWDTQTIKDKVDNVLDESVTAYNEALATQVAPRLDAGALPRFVYTPLHGVGLRYMAGAFARARGQGDVEREAGNLMYPVAEQAVPDPDFPTVRFPNPEEDGALDLAKSAADTLGIRLVLANDPDADRFAAAEKIGNGEWHTFKGDELGVLLGHYLWESSREGGTKGRGTTASSDTAERPPTTMLVSAVSSQMLAAVGDTEGFAVEETLTGFKWIGNRAREIGRGAVFGYEEALGYMLPDVVFDKDGVAAALLFLEMCSRGQSGSWELGLSSSPYARLQQLYAKYGHFQTMNTYWKSPDIATTAAALAAMRADPTRRVIEALGADPNSTKTRVRDLMEGTDSGAPDGRAPELWSGPDSQMLTVWLSASAEQEEEEEKSDGSILRDGVRYTVRASGTEPKIKIYVECRSRRGAEEARAGALAVLRAVARTWFGGAELRVEERFRELLE